MRLPKEDVELFYALYHPLLVYVNKKLNVVDGIDSPEDFKRFSLEHINMLRKRLYEQPQLIDSFVSENPLDFSPDRLETIRNWRHFVTGTFYIWRYLKDYTIFLDPHEPPKAYGVLALYSPFDELIGPDLPTMVEAVLLPFMDKIVYDGVLFPYRAFFGRGIRTSLNDAFQEAKARFGIITSLPFSPQKVKQSDEDRLKFYLRSKRNREIYWEEIDALISRDPDLLTLYHQEMGKVHARTYKKRLRQIGLTNAWFAVLEGLIVASGPTKEEVERILQSILPAEKRQFAYIFQFKQ